MDYKRGTVQSHHLHRQLINHHMPTTQLLNYSTTQLLNYSTSICPPAVGMLIVGRVILVLDQFRRGGKYTDILRT